MLAAGIPLLSPRQLSGNFIACRKQLLLDVDTRDGTGKRRGVFLRISSKTTCQEANPRHSPTEEQFGTSLIRFPQANSTQELGDER